MRAKPPNLLAQGQGSPCSACGPGRPGAHPAAGQPPSVGVRGAAALGLAWGCWTWQRGEVLWCPPQGQDRDPSTPANTALSHRPPQGTLPLCRVQSVPGDPGWQIPARNSKGSPRWLCPPMAIFTCTLNPNLLLEAELEAAAAPGRTNPCGRALRMLPWQLPLPGSSTPSRAEGSLCPGITFRVPCWASWQELSPGGARSLEARQELCSSSASKASAPRHPGQAPQPLAAHPAVLYPSQNLRSKRSVTAGPAVQLPVP